jgi:L-ascorbate metabolism protein UlaG (beta-lactamase superfamily)
MSNNLSATVFVYRSRIDGRVHAEYIDTARVMDQSPDWEHIATLEPRRWIQVHYEDADLLKQALEALQRADKISGYANNKKVIDALKERLN